MSKLLMSDFRSYLANFVIRPKKTLGLLDAKVSKPAWRIVKPVFQKFVVLPARVKLGVITILALILIPLALQYHHQQLYTVSAASRQLVSKSSIDTSKLKVSGKTISYTASAQKPTGDKSVTIAGPTDATGTTGYTATINKDFKAGLTFGDSPSDSSPSDSSPAAANLPAAGAADAGNNLSFHMTPLFGASAGEYHDGQIMFPVSASTKVFQTFKKNGIKEDIVLSKAPAKTAQWQWKLGLGDKLEAKLLPDGSVGVFAANPILYGNLQVSDAKSQALVDKARTADKSYLAFAIPAPFIKNAQGQTLKEDVSFKLDGDTLTLEARNLTNQHYPISIDPSVVVTTTADFATGSDDGMINYSTTNQIGRSVVGLGSVGTTAQQTSAFTTSRSKHTSVVYNGYLYIIGGINGTALNDIQFATINSNGSLSCPVGYTCSIGVFAATTSFTTPRYGHTSVAYNGYLYIIGGINGTKLNDIQHCPINSDGSVGTCVQQTNAFTTARFYHTSVVYNGYLYVIGGCSAISSDCTVFKNDIQHLAINADGSVGTTVTQAAAFSGGRHSHTSVAYNGYLYVIGGCSAADTIGCTTYRNDIQHLAINADGSVGTTVLQAAAFTTAREGHTSVAYNGYLYVIGGCSAPYCSVSQDDIQHCPINSDGAVGTCVTEAAAFTTARSGHTSVAYNGYLYVIGAGDDVQHLLVDTGTPTGLGAASTFTTNTNYFSIPRYSHTSVAYNGYLYVIGGQESDYDTNCKNAGTSGYCNDIQYAAINSNGSIGTFTTNTNYFSIPRYYHTSVAYNGYLYVIGGQEPDYDTNCKNAGNNTKCNDIQYAAINSNGSIGTFTTNTNYFSFPRNGHTSVAYNGYLYVIGGQESDSDTNCKNAGTSNYCNDIQYAAINSNGSIGTFTTNTNYFSTPRSSHTSVAYNGYLYVIGGAEDTSDTNCKNAGTTFDCNDIQYAAINSNGSIGTFTTNTNYFSFPRYYHTSVAYNGYLYVIGGVEANYDTNCKNAGTNSYCNDVQYANLKAPAQSAHYERVVDIGETADSIDSIQYNGTAKCGAKIQYATAGSDGIFGSTTTLTSDAVAGTTYAISGQTVKHYVRVVVTLSDQSCGGTSVVTDLTVNYTLLTSPPAAPTLSAPTSGVSGVSATPVFQFKSTDTADVYAQYKIIVYQSDCSTVVRTIDQTGSQTGWSGQDAQTSTAYVIGTTLGASTLASHTYQATALSYNTTYCWKAAGIDPGGSNTFGAYSATQLFTTSQLPTTPTLIQPTTSQSGVPTLPGFRISSTDADNDYLKYKIEVCSTSNCSVVVRTIDQTSSQTGWASQSQQGATAYSSGQTAIHTYQATALSANTQYWWRAYAIDPGGTNTFSSASSIGSFTTSPTTQANVSIGGGTSIYGGTTIAP